MIFSKDKKLAFAWSALVILITPLTACNFLQVAPGTPDIPKEPTGKGGDDRNSFKEDFVFEEKSISGPVATEGLAQGANERKAFETCLKGIIQAGNGNDVFSEATIQNAFASSLMNGLPGTLLSNPADMPRSILESKWAREKAIRNRSSGLNVVDGTNFPCNAEYSVDNSGAFSGDNGLLLSQREANIDAGMLNVRGGTRDNGRGTGGSVFGGAFICKGARAVLPAQYQLEVSCKALGEVGLEEGQRSLGIDDRFTDKIVPIKCNWATPATGAPFPCCVPGYTPSLRKFRITSTNYGMESPDPISNEGRVPGWYPTCVKNGGDPRVQTTCPAGQRPSKIKLGTCVADNFSTFGTAQGRLDKTNIITYNKSLCWGQDVVLCMGEYTRCKYSKALKIYLAYNKYLNISNQAQLHATVGAEFNISANAAQNAWYMVQGCKSLSDSRFIPAFNFLANPDDFNDGVCSEYGDDGKFGEFSFAKPVNGCVKAW